MQIVCPGLPQRTWVAQLQLGNQQDGAYKPAEFASLPPVCQEKKRTAGRRGGRPPSAGEIESHKCVSCSRCGQRGGQPQRLLEVCVAYPQVDTQAEGKRFAGQTWNFAEFFQLGSKPGTFGMKTGTRLVFASQTRRIRVFLAVLHSSTQAASLAEPCCSTIGGDPFERAYGEGNVQRCGR